MIIIEKATQKANPHGVYNTVRSTPPPPIIPESEYDIKNRNIPIRTAVLQAVDPVVDRKLPILIGYKKPRHQNHVLADNQTLFDSSLRQGLFKYIENDGGIL
jgi:hypothetical protein